MKKDAHPAQSPLFNQSLEKGLAVLQSFSTQRRSMTLQEVAEASDISKSSAQRLIYTLETLGLVRRNAVTKRFQLAPGVMRVGCNYLDANPLIDAANPFLASLSSASEESVALTEPDGLEMVYVARFTTHKSIPIHVPIGRRMPMYCTSAGRAYLSALPKDAAIAILQQSDRQTHTEYTCTDLQQLTDLLEVSKRRGFAHNNQEYYLGDINVAAPILNSWGKPIAAVHIAAPNIRWQLAEALEKLGPMVIDCARAISSSARALE